MLYTILGTDRKKTRQCLHTVLVDLQKKQPDADTVFFDEDSFSLSALQERIGAQGLFSLKSIVVLDGVCGHEEYKGGIMEKLPELESTDNMFLVIEEKLDAKTKKKFEKHSYAVKVFLKETQKEKPTIFSLADVLGQRDRKKTWISYIEELKKGVAVEELHGVLFWQIKNLLMTSLGDTTTLKPFVLSKNKKYTQNYSLEELKMLEKRLVRMYADSRRGICDFETSLESFILALC